MYFIFSECILYNGVFIGYHTRFYVYVSRSYKVLTTNLFLWGDIKSKAANCADCNLYLSFLVMIII